MIAGLLAVAAASRSSADQFYWQGDNNDNWVNAGNWEQSPGSGDIPENPNDVVTFDYLADVTDVDLNGNTYDVGEMTAHSTDYYNFYHGTLRLNDTFSVLNHCNAHFASDLTIEQAVPDTWSIWDSDMVMDGPLTGTANILLDGNGNLTFNAINPYSGTLSISFMQVILGQDRSLQNCTVVNYTNPSRLDVTGVNAILGGLAGSGAWDIGTTTVSIGRINGNTTYTGDISGGGSIFKQGTGSLTLSGVLDNLDTIANTGGDLILSGGGEVLRILAQQGTTRVRTGTFNVNNAVNNAFFVSGTSTASIENGAAVTLSSAGSSNRVVLTNDATLSVADSGSTLVTPRLDIGPSGPGSAQVTVQSGGAMDAERIQVGDLASDNGAAGTLSVLVGGSVDAGATILYRRGSIDIPGGTLSTNTLADGDAETHLISISNANEIPALTVGASGGSSVVAALIQDSTAGPGTVRKIGPGTLELVNANTYSGNTHIDGGTVLANNSAGSATGSGGVFIRDGGTLGGSGSIAGTVIVYTGGSVAPGAPVGTLGVHNIAFNPATTLVVEIAGTNNSDALAAVDVANLGGTLDLVQVNGFTASPGDSFVIVSAVRLIDSFDTVNFPDDQTWTIDYDYEAGTVTVGVCADADADGVCDANDVCPGADDNLDTDSDGLPDGCDSCAAGAASGDANGDGRVDGFDYGKFLGCMMYYRAGQPSGCECFDFNSDGYIDLRDFATFQVRFTGP